jgi:hypothetical protein
MASTYREAVMGLRVVVINGWSWIADDVTETEIDGPFRYIEDARDALAELEQAEAEDAAQQQSK